MGVIDPLMTMPNGERLRLADGGAGPSCEFFQLHGDPRFSGVRAGQRARSWAKVVTAKQID